MQQLIFAKFINLSHIGICSPVFCYIYLFSAISLLRFDLEGMTVIRDGMPNNLVFNTSVINKGITLQANSTNNFDFQLYLSDTDSVESKYSHCVKVSNCGPLSNCAPAYFFNQEVCYDMCSKLIFFSFKTR